MIPTFLLFIAPFLSVKNDSSLIDINKLNFSFHTVKKNANRPKIHSPHTKSTSNSCFIMLYLPSVRSSQYGADKKPTSVLLV